MDCFNFHKQIEGWERQIRRPVSCLYSACLVSSIILIVSLYSSENRIISICISIFIVLYGVFDLKNDRVLYDHVGITLFSIWGKPFSKSWKEVSRVEIVEEPLISRQLFVGRVLIIQCIEQKNNKSDVAIYRYPYRYYVGIDEFLSFYYENVLEKT